MALDLRALFSPASPCAFTRQPQSRLIHQQYKKHRTQNKLHTKTSRVDSRVVSKRGKKQPRKPHLRLYRCRGQSFVRTNWGHQSKRSPAWWTGKTNPIFFFWDLKTNKTIWKSFKQFEFIKNFLYVHDSYLLVLCWSQHKKITWPDRVHFLFYIFKCRYLKCRLDMKSSYHKENNTLVWFLYIRFSYRQIENRSCLGICG